LTLNQSVTGIGKHTETLKSVFESAGGKVGKERCKGMEGLIAEAKKHALEEDLQPSMRDLVIIAQYQRMSHYGLAGFGTAAAYAAALGERDGRQSSQPSSRTSTRLTSTPVSLRSGLKRQRQRPPEQGMGACATVPSDLAAIPPVVAAKVQRLQISPG
jgi:hypothetical protein